MSDGCGRFERATAREDAAVWAELEAHASASGCPDCAARLALWREIGEAAPTLRKEWPSPDLDRRLAEAFAARRPAFPGSAPAARYRWIPAAAVAALVVLSVVGVRVFRDSAGREPLASSSASRAVLLTDQALAEVETTEAAYLASIEKLSQLAGPRLQNSTSPFAVAQREKLLLLDSEIAEMRGEIERNRFNTHLRRELLAIYREKQRTLQDLMKGES